MSSRPAPPHSATGDTAPIDANPDDAALLDAGLTDQQVRHRAEAGRANAQPQNTSRSLWSIVSTHLFTMFNLVIGLCALAIIVLGRWLDLLFCLAAVANVLIGVVQEYSAKRKLDGIALLNQSNNTVLRSGRRQQVPPSQVVLDDAVILHQGDQVPVDGRVLESAGLSVDESLLTGESDPVFKRPGDPVLSGTSVLAGSATVRATRVGADSHINQLTVQARQFVKIGSELRAALEKVAKWLTFALVPLVAVIVHGQVMAEGGWSFVLSQRALESPLVATVAGVTTMIPQGLALMTTISFALASLSLAQRKVLIQEQPAVELLARVDTVCLDKTGTLTEGTIVFNETLGPDSPEDHGDVASPAWQHVLGWFGASPNANSTALALGEQFPLSEEQHQHLDDLLFRHTAFSADRRWSSASFGGDDLAGTWVLGAPEPLLARLENGPEHDRWAQLCSEQASAGLRTMLLARGEDQPEGTEGTLPVRLHPVVVLTFKEKVREDAAETLRYFHDQGVQLKVISGDNPRTVTAVAREVGMEVSGPGVEGHGLPEDPQELADVATQNTVFGRVSPQQKKDLVQALQSRGHVVAMTGDGINDTLALKHADLGIAMGDSAAATKAVSRMVLLDSKFSRLPHVLAEGRTVIANIERLAHLFLAKTCYAVLFAVVFSLLFWQYPMLPRQASTMDALMIGIPSFFLAMVPNPRRYVSGFLNRALRFAVPTGVVMVLGLLVLNIYLRNSSEITLPQLHTASFITLTLMGLWTLNVCSRPLNKWKILLMGSMHAGLVLVLVVPVSLWYHQFELPTTPVLAVSVGIAAVVCGLIEIIHRIHMSRISLAPQDPVPAS